MSRISTTFKKLKTENHKGLITFIMGGDPDFNSSVEILKSMPAAGADIIEIGMPFSDPVADGEIIQRAGIRALASGMTLKKVLEMVRIFREDNQYTPIVLMGYSNPIHAYTEELFFKDAATAGVDGVLIVDTPPEEGTLLVKYAKSNNIDIIRLATPTTDNQRIHKITDGADGFLYYVSIAGVTGTASADITTVKAHITELKKETDLPIAIGFGIKTPQDAKEMSTIGDAVVVGSALIQTIESSEKDQVIEKLSTQIRALSDALV